MARTVAVGFSLSRVALLGALSIVFAGAAAAQGKVGITSATDGDPLGKPPSENERILRIGIDVQANELITTKADDRAHLLFLDGTSLTIGPNAALTIDKFVYDPTTKRGDLAINVSKGVFRLVGGKISKTNAISIQTPSSTIGIRGGITIGDVGPTQTSSVFVFGDKLTVTSQGQTQSATRPGTEIVTHLGSVPGLPALVAHGGLSGQLGQLEGVQRGNGNGASGGGGGSGSPGGGTFQGNADKGAQNFGKQNTAPPVLANLPALTQLVNSITRTTTSAVANAGNNANGNGGGNGNGNGNGNSQGNNGNGNGNGNGNSNGNGNNGRHGRHG